MLRKLARSLHLSSSSVEEDEEGSAACFIGTKPFTTSFVIDILSRPSSNAIEGDNAVLLTDDVSIRRKARRQYGDRRHRTLYRGALEPFLERWIAVTYRLHVLFPSFSVNENFAPIPTMCAFYALTQTLPKFKRDDVREMLDFNVNCLQELRSAIGSVPQLPPATMFSFIKIIVNDDSKTVVSENLMKKMKDLTKNNVILACTPQRVGRFLRSLSGGAIDGPRSAHGLTTAYAAAGLRAGWCGKASPVSSSAFAVTYSVRQNHPFIQLETDAKVASLYNCEVWEIPLRTEKAMFHFCLIRPKFIGEIVKLKSKMLPEDLKDILDELLKSKTQRCKILLPVFSITSHENLYSVWMKHTSPQALESNKSLPPFDAIWNLSKISVDLEGVGVRSLQSEACPQLPSLFRNYWTLDDLSRPHTPFTAAIDSSFLFVITQKGTPLLAGCYAGNPAPQNSAFSVLAPAKIRNKSPPKEIPRPKEKLTKIQKKGEKIRRKRAAKMKRQAAEVLRKTRKRKKTMMKKARRTTSSSGSGQ